MTDPKALVSIRILPHLTNIPTSGRMKLNSQVFGVHATVSTLHPLCDNMRLGLEEGEAARSGAALLRQHAPVRLTRPKVT